MGLFCTSNDAEGLQEPELLQSNLNMLIGLFRQYRLLENVAKSKAMTCHTGTLNLGMSEWAVGQRYMGRGKTQH